jgi:hypothetical protein
MNSATFVSKYQGSWDFLPQTFSYALQNGHIPSSTTATNLKAIPSCLFLAVEQMGQFSQTDAINRSIFDAGLLSILSLHQSQRNK